MGLAEAIKYGLIKKASFLRYMEESLDAVFACNKDVLAHVVTVSASIKAKIVSQDEHDVKDIRALLNFGHTIGHAIEASSSYDEYSHGEAVAIGSLCALRISLALGCCKSAHLVSRVEELFVRSGLRTGISAIPLNKNFKKSFS